MIILRWIQDDIKQNITYLLIIRIVHRYVHKLMERND